MKSKIEKLIMLLLIFPSFVMAKSSSDMGLFEIVMAEAFITIHMTIFVHVPIAKLLSASGKIEFKKLLKKFVVGRILILIIGDLILGEAMLLIDFFSVFIGAFIVMPIIAVIVNRKNGTPLAAIVSNSTVAPSVNPVTIPAIVKDYTTSAIITNSVLVKSVEDIDYSKTKAVDAANKKISYRECFTCHTLNDADNAFCTNCGNKFEAQVIFNKPGYCPKCHAKLNPGVKYCVNCGIEIGSYFLNQETTVPAETEVDHFFYQSEELMLDSIITKELEENHYDKKMVIPAIRRRKLLLTFIFALVTFITICLIFFHLPAGYYLVYFIFFILYIHNVSRYDVKQYIIKQIKSRPDEKINNVVASVVASATTTRTGSLEYVAMFIVAIMLPLVIFSKPKIFYEKMDNGYGMRFYAFGWSEMTKATIPDTYKGEPVVSLRGNAFSNMYFLKEVELPDTITEIRGQAFKNDIMLEKVNIPSNLEYLGGGSFYNCISITEVELPNTVTEMGGETFYGAQKLKVLVLPDKLTEIRGSTCEGCSSLKEITIPDSVVRIGGHAFHGASSLETVNISYNSQLKEIGSSAFRDCVKLSEITIPSGVSVNERAFKGSGTVVKNFVRDERGNLVNFSKTESYSFYEGSEFIYYDKNYNEHSLKLDKVSSSRSGYVYNFTYAESTGSTKKVTVYSSDKGKFITDDLYIDVKSAYNGYITLMISYNR